MDAAPLPFIACAFVLLIAIAGIDAHHGSRSVARSIREVLLLAALHFALAACVLIAAISLGNAA
ncbi:hypothetical protein ACN9MF_11420 [Methylobacterium fujisawaense]|jgi:hypothetical protein|uniref:hypothetical protein n=1 Tax=Methylobacterium fujisawaense TaxID=107400 RepID=UPI003CF45C17